MLAMSSMTSPVSENLVEDANEPARVEAVLHQTVPEVLNAKLADRRSAYFVPLAAMLLSDLGIAVLMGDLSMGLHAMIPVIYGSYALMVIARD